MFCRLTLVILTSLVTFGSTSAQDEPSEAVDAIRLVLETQQAAWNEGDYEGFMDGYWRSDSLTFASNGSYNRGWTTTLENYRLRYPDRKAMGTLTFTLYDIEVLSESSGFVFGRYELERENDRPTGLFTLLLRKFDNEWKIVFDHTSSRPVEGE